MIKRRDLSFITIFLIALLFIFRDIIFLKISFLKGDYLQQFFPWYSLYSQEIKQFHLPFWTRFVQCGFPLFAEGQLGALYPFNILFFFLLPFKAAYNYSFIFHLFLSGVFVYLFTKKIGADPWGAMLSAVFLCFGSAYAGCFINISALKALCWFPLVLLIFEEYLEKEKRGFLIPAGLIVGFQVLAGSFQMAIYAIFFSILYCYCRGRAYGRGFIRLSCDMATILIIGFLISLPQLLATFEIAQHSNRPSGGLDFALWNSFSPLSLLGSVIAYPAGIFSRGSLIYIGIMGLFFAMLAVYFLREDKYIRVLIIIFLVSLFLALGKYNPFYVILLKLSHIYYFRAPARFIYFAIFSLSVLGGYGFSYFFSNREKLNRQFYRFFMRILILSLAVFAGIKLALAVSGPFILNAAKNYVTANIYGKPYHRYDLQSYLHRTEEFYRALVEGFSTANPYNISGLVFILLMIFLIYRFMRSNSKSGLFNRYLCFIFICFELYTFSLFSKGIRQDLADFSYIEPAAKGIFDIIKADKGFFRIMPFGNMPDLPLWVRPSMNAFYGIDSVAIYSPLADSDYFIKTEGLGIVDDSLGVRPPDARGLDDKIELIRHLNVKYIVSSLELNLPSLVYLVKEGRVYLYEVKDYLARVFFSGNAAIIQIDKYDSGQAEVSLDAAEDGLLVFSEKFYPGWLAYIDGKNTGIERYMDILQAVKVSRGRHRIIFRYRG